LSNRQRPLLASLCQIREKLTPEKAICPTAA
jgi:hypothetical protein